MSPKQGGLAVVKIELGEANAYVDRYHRHSKPVVQCVFALGAVAGGEIVGVAIVESPKARGLLDGWTLEVTRCCTDGYRNACSFLYGAAWRQTKGFGFLRSVTYTKASESGASLRAAGYVSEGFTKGRDWDTPSRRRQSKHEISDRIRWEIRTAAWQPDLPARPRVAIHQTNPDQLELAA